MARSKISRLFIALLFAAGLFPSCSLGQTEQDGAIRVDISDIDETKSLSEIKDDWRRIASALNISLENLENYVAEHTPQGSETSSATLQDLIIWAEQVNASKSDPQTPPDENADKDEDGDSKDGEESENDGAGVKGDVFSISQLPLTEDQISEYLRKIDPQNTKLKDENGNYLRDENLEYIKINPGTHPEKFNMLLYSKTPVEYEGGLVVIPDGGFKSPKISKSDLGSYDQNNKVITITSAADYIKNVSYSKYERHSGFKLDNGEWKWSDFRNVDMFQSNYSGLTFLIVGDSDTCPAAKTMIEKMNNGFTSQYGAVKFYNWTYNNNTIADDKGDSYLRHLRQVLDCSYFLFPENEVAIGFPPNIDTSLLTPTCFLLKNGITVASFYGNSENHEPYHVFTFDDVKEYFEKIQ